LQERRGGKEEEQKGEVCPGCGSWLHMEHLGKSFCPCLPYELFYQRFIFAVRRRLHNCHDPSAALKETMLRIFGKMITRLY